MEPVCHKVVFLGDSFVGKTAIINQYIFSSCSEEHKTTIAIDFFTKNLVIDGQPVRLIIWDTAGQEKFNALIPSYIHNSSIAILVFDITSQQSFENIKKWHKTVVDSADPALFLVGNKIDLEDQREVEFNSAKKFAEEIGAKYVETSARTPINIDTLFNEVARVPAKPSEEPHNIEEKQQTITVTVDLKNQQNESQQGGCGC